MKKRRCKNCDKPFEPKREWQEFCVEGCRKEFWRHGGVSLARIRPALEAMIQAEVKRLMPAAIAKQLRLMQSPPAPQG